MRDNGSREAGFVARVVAKVVKGLLFVILACAIGGWLVMALWNWLMPVLFGLKAITFWQALGLLVLSKILLGGFHKHTSGGRRDWKRGGWNGRWERMTPEERETFRAGMRSRRGCGWGGQNSSGPHDETTEQSAQ